MMSCYTALQIRLIRNDIGLLRANIRLLECGPMPNVMAALPNIGGALCSTPQSLADAHYWSVVGWLHDVTPVAKC